MPEYTWLEVVWSMRQFHLLLSENQVSKVACFFINDEIIIGAGFGDSFFIQSSDSFIRNQEPQGSFFFIYDISNFL